MFIVDTALERRQQDGNPIRIGIVGAGYMGQAMTVTIERNLVGMRVVAIANRTVETAERVFAEAGIDESVQVSDLERTIIDGLRQPEYCGGVTEVAKGLWMRHQDMQPTKLVDYALRIGTGAVLRRLGYLLELYAIAPPSELERLRSALSETYAPLDPMLPGEGTHLRRWRLLLNITPDELESVRAS